MLHRSRRTRARATLVTRARGEKMPRIFEFSMTLARDSCTAPRPRATACCWLAAPLRYAVSLGFLRVVRIAHFLSRPTPPRPSPRGRLCPLTRTRFPPSAARWSVCAAAGVGALASCIRATSTTRRSRTRRRSRTTSASSASARTTRTSATSSPTYAAAPPPLPAGSFRSTLRARVRDVLLLLLLSFSAPPAWTRPAPPLRARS